MAGLYFPATGTRSRLAHVAGSRTSLGLLPQLHTLCRVNGLAGRAPGVMDHPEAAKHLDIPDSARPHERDQCRGI